jgi:hypothetical protein
MKNDILEFRPIAIECDRPRQKAERRTPLSKLAYQQRDIMDLGFGTASGRMAGGAELPAC